MPAARSASRPFSPRVERLNPHVYLPFKPTNENGVVFIFALVAKRLGFEVDVVRASFPDCLARWEGQTTRIEFEFASKNFAAHGHKTKECDLIICWKHNWPAVPPKVAVLELRKLFGLVPDVFIVAYRDDQWRQLPDRGTGNALWSVPSSCGPDDLLIVYKPGAPAGGDEGAVTDVFRVATAPERALRDDTGEPDWMAGIERVARLRRPLPFSRLRELGAHGGIESRPKRTAQWPQIYRALVDECAPSNKLAKYAPITQ